WQAKVWARFRHRDLAELRDRSRKYVAAVLRQRAARVEAAPERRPFPGDWKFDLRKRPGGRLVYLRRSGPNSQVVVLGKTWPLGQVWPNRLVRCEVDLGRNEIHFFTLRRKEPTSQPRILKVDYRLPNRGFRE